jgi:hypothetical protein
MAYTQIDNDVLDDLYTTHYDADMYQYELVKLLRVIAKEDVLDDDIEYSGIIFEWFRCIVVVVISWCMLS